MANDPAINDSAKPLGRRYSLLALAAGALLGALLASRWTPADSPSSQASLTSDSPYAAEVVRPDPAWSPREVVQRQMKALTASRTHAGMIRHCFALASPANRQITGPVDRFAAMVAMPPYRSLIDARSYLVGEPIIKGRYAAVLVSLVTVENRSYAFRFLLSQQTDDDVADCWMTDGVSQILPAPRPPVPSPSHTEPGV